MKRLIKLTTLVLVALIGLQLSPQTAEAAFDKNNLISDSLFTDTDSMSVSEIQSFLNSQGSLLANWVDNVDMRRPSDNCIVHHATGMTAAEIIHEAATAWGAQVYNGNDCAVEGKYWSDPEYSGYTLETVSPKVLLVTLQKEQSLISADGSYSTNPNSYKDPACCSSNEYKLARAMGYGVPDSGGINEKFLGFYNQINWAAWQLRYNFERSGSNTSWDEVGHLTYGGPMVAGNGKRCASCSVQLFDGYYPIDGQSLFMENRATASLYYYTPHTYPGFFGNFNFVNFYENWFGSTQVSVSHVLVSCSDTNYLVEINRTRKREVTESGLANFNFNEESFEENSFYCSFPTYSIPLDAIIRSRKTGKSYFVDNGIAYFIHSQSVANAWDLGPIASSTFAQLDSDTITNLLQIEQKLPIVVTSDNPSVLTHYLIDDGSRYPIAGSSTGNTDSIELISGYSSLPVRTVSVSKLLTLTSEPESIDYNFTDGSTWYLLDHFKIRKVPTWALDRWSGVLDGPTLSSSFISNFGTPSGSVGLGFKRDAFTYRVSSDGSETEKTDQSVVTSYYWDLGLSPTISRLLKNKVIGDIPVATIEPALNNNVRLILCSGQEYLVERFIPIKRTLTPDAVTHWKFDDNYFNSDDEDKGCDYSTYGLQMDRLVRSRNTQKVYYINNGVAYYVHSQEIANEWGFGDLASTTFPYMNGANISANLSIVQQLPSPDDL